MRAWPKHHGHEEKGVRVIEILCTRLRIPTEYRMLSVLVSRLHLNIHRLYALRPETIVKQLEKADAFRRKELFINLLIACEADAKGCGNFAKKYPQRAHWLTLFEACEAIKPHTLLDKGLSGKAIKEGLHQLRVECVKKIIATWSIDEK
jgi:tRNA nucleotidyltransferase (CCA-adding enzyme)